jgi:predicted ATPase
MPTDAHKAVTRIQVEGFKSLRNVTLAPGRVTVLIGPNGSGKSNLLALLQLVPLMHTGTLQQFVARRGGASALLHYGPKVTETLRIRLDFQQDSGANAYQAELGYGAGDSLFVSKEQASFQSGGKERLVIVDAGRPESNLRRVAQTDGNPTLKTVSWWLSQMNFYHFHDTSLTSALRQNAPVSQDRFLHSEGRNLAAFLYRLRHSVEPGDQTAWRRISLLVQRIAPAVAELIPTSVVPGQDPPTHVRLDWRDDRGETFGVQDLSDGTLRAIALVTALGQPASTLPAFVTIDEPELGLHPAALALFAGLVRSVSTRCQVVIATQSPALLDHFQSGDVVVVDRVDGESRFQRLDEERLASWLAEYSLSELFEKNLLEGRP